MSARMVGEELAREALGAAGSGPDAAAAGEKKKAEATAKQAIAEIRKEAESSGGNVLGELDTIVAGLSQDIEAIMLKEIEEVRVEAASDLMLQGMSDRLRDVLGTHILVAEATDADSIMKRLLSELEASRGREERLLKIVEGSREPEREIAFGKRSEDELAYEAGRKAQSSNA